MLPDHRIADVLRVFGDALRRVGPVEAYGFLLARDDGTVVRHARYAWGVTAHETAAGELPPLESVTADAEVVEVPLDASSRLFVAAGNVTAEAGEAYAAIGREMLVCARERESDGTARDRLERLDRLETRLASLETARSVGDVLLAAAAILRAMVPHDEVSAAERLPSHGHDDGRRYALVDRLQSSPAHAAALPAASGFQSALQIPVRWRGQVVGSLSALSIEPARYSAGDLFIMARLAARAGFALSHAHLSEERLRLFSRTRVVEQLDHLLAPLATTGSLKAVFEQVSTVAKEVLPHDAVMLPVRVGDGTRAMLHASAGMGDVPATIPVPAHLIDNPDWDYDIVTDIQTDPAQSHTIGARLGYRGMLRLSVQLDGEFAGALVFLSRVPGIYSEDDLPLARRLTDRLSIALSRERREEAFRRADEATARASRLESRVEQLSGELDARTGVRHVVGESAPWREVLMQTTQVAGTNATVLLLGESGTGKEVIARFLHRASQQADGPFVGLNCAALPEHLLEAELFGYERGAFTGATQSKPGRLEQAAGGTLFLDEVGEMSLAFQAKFLRALQEREFQRLGGTRVLTTDARIVAATNRDLERAIANGQFREDLFYRLNVFSIHLPPLRDRPDDILLLAETFIADIGRAFGRPPAGLSREARQGLLEYTWPGNVRELRNVLERAAILCDGGLITSDHLALRVDVVSRRAASDAAAGGAPPRPPAAGTSAPADLASMERAMIEQALRDTRFNKSRAAKVLGLTRAQLYVRLRKHGLE